MMTPQQLLTLIDSEMIEREILPECDRVPYFEGGK
jgi:hypothetical protein